jgi:pimeloyl-ACP methyl ester carboxylesterase
MVVVCTAVAIIAAGCSTAGTKSLRVERTGAITWTPCRNGTVQCATLAVPLDNAHPDGERISLALARRPASGKRTGVLLTNPGGPGASGIAFLEDAAVLFRPDILKRFDIVSWDPRGVGDSAPVRCLDDLDAFYAVDRTPENADDVARNVAAARDFAASCKRRSGSEIGYVSTTASVRDMDAIRAAIGVERISYIGFSYGTLLGALYADRYPQRVRTMVLDGAIDPALSSEESTIGQAKGFEEVLDAFFAWCRQDTRCGFARGGDPRDAFDRLTRAVAAEPTPGTVNGEERTLGPGEFDIGVASALYAGRAGFPDLADALAAAARGTGDQLLTFADQYTERQPNGKYSNQTAAFYATSCIDAPAARTVAAVQQLADAAARVAPHFGASTAWLGLPCTFWPVQARGEPVAVHAAGAPPVLVVGTIHDPATPYAWAQSLAGELRGSRLLTFEGDGHTGYARGSACVDDAVEDYLLTGTLPPEGTRCPAP